MHYAVAADGAGYASTKTILYPYCFLVMDKLSGEKTAKRTEAKRIKQWLRGQLKKDLRRVIPDVVWREAGRRGLLTDALKDPGVLMYLKSLARIQSQGSLHRDEREDAKRWEGDLRSNARYRDVRTTVLEILGTSPSGPWRIPTMDDAFTPYVERMALVLSDPDGGPYFDGYPSPIRGGFRGGRIVVEAEPWVPREHVFAFYRELQDHIGGTARKFLHQRTLGLYLWARNRRDAIKETWRESMEAWKEYSGHEYKHESNFHKDYHRTEHAIVNAKAEVAKLREAALAAELELGPYE